MAQVQKLVTEDSFVNGVFVPAGQIASYDEAELNGKEPHIHDPSGLPAAIVEMAPIGPTGPNPTAPQQISPDTVQGPGGGYVRPGAAAVVGQTTAAAEERLAGRTDADDSSEGDLTETLRKANEENARLRAELASQANGREPAASTANDDDDLVGGTVAEVTATLGEKSNEELEAIRAAEVDREKPRAGVLNAIKAELNGRG